MHSFPVVYSRSIFFSFVIALTFITVKLFAQTWELEVPEEPFNFDSPSKIVAYQPIEAAKKHWKICASYPHMKDNYWLSVNYGMVEEAKRLGLSLAIVDAGGYPNLERQKKQVEDCVKNSTDALVVGTVSFSGLSSTLTKIAKNIPVLATVNDISNEGISAKSGVSWFSMGKSVGKYLAEKHPKGSSPVNISWLPGPTGSGWVPYIDQGFRSGIANGAINIVDVRWGDTGKEIQRTLIQEALEATNQNIDYIVGNAPAAEAAVSILRREKLTDKIGILSTYLTHGIYRGIKRHRILAAPTDSPVAQGRLSIIQAVRVLEEKDYVKHAGPKIVLVDETNVDNIDLDTSLAPASFLPTYRVDHGYVR